MKKLFEGVRLTELRQITDYRGAVLHMLRSDAPDFSKFGECYFSEIFSGSVKAWKKHTLQTQNLTVPVGRIRLVMYDNREQSTTKGEVCILEIGRPDAYIRVTIAPEIWYGFKCISEEHALLVNCADIPHEKNESEVLDVNDVSIPYSWNTLEKDIVTVINI